MSTSTYKYYTGNTVTGDVVLPAEPNGYKLIEIGEMGFYNCVNMTSISIPETVTHIEDYAFDKCTGLKHFTIPMEVTHIGHMAFINCSSLIDIIIPPSVKEIENSAFWRCTSLSKFTLPSTVEKIGEQLFYGCTLKPLIIQGDYDTINLKIFSNMNNDSEILFNTYSLNSLKNIFKNSTWKNNIYAYDNIYNLTANPTRTGCELTVAENPYFQSENCTDYKIEFKNDNEGEGSETFFTLEDVRPGTYSIYGGTLNSKVIATFSWKEDEKVHEGEFSFTTAQTDISFNISNQSTPTTITITDIKYHDNYSEEFHEVTEVGVYFRGNKYPLEDKILIENLNIGTFYPFIPYLLYNGGKDEYKGKINDICTSGVDFNINYSNTQTSITITDISVTPSDEFEILEKGIEYKGTTYKLTDKIILDDLCPQNTYSVYPYIVYRDANTRYRNNRYDLSTKAWDKTPSVVVGPTSLVLKGNFFDSNEVEPTECWWVVAGETYQGKNVVVTGLNPNTKYTPVFNWTYESPQNEKKTYTSNTFPKEWTTPALTLKTLAPKCVSSTCAIVAAETNILDVEPMVGFQWKKYDAPATLAPNEGFGAVCDGVVEGYIKNLQSAFYYDVRAFYKNAAGNYYYSDWVTFDPSDFSFFEPTVRTYPVQEVSANTAMVRGYALAGTENIKSQGFQYWASSGPSNAKMYAPANSEVTTVVATGQIMTATFEDLLPGTSYTYRAFVETDAGFTFGDEQKFTTNESPSSYVETIVSEDEAPVIIGYFDLSGRRYSVMQPGMNIIVYSDGSTRKVMNR